MVQLHRMSTPEIVARNIARNIAEVESRSTSATLRPTISGVDTRNHVAIFSPWIKLMFPRKVNE